MNNIDWLLKEAKIQADENQSKDVRHFAGSVLEAFSQLKSERDALAEQVRQYRQQLGYFSEPDDHNETSDGAFRKWVVCHSLRLLDLPDLHTDILKKQVPKEGEYICKEHAVCRKVLNHYANGREATMTNIFADILLHQEKVPTNS